MVVLLWLRRALLALVLLVVLTLAGLFLLGALGMAIPLARLTPEIEAMATSALDRPVHAGRLALVPTLDPTLLIEDLVLESALEFPQPLVRLERARVSLDLFALLRGRVRIPALEASGLRVVLDRDASGVGSWSDAIGEEAEAHESEGGRPPIVDLVAVSLRDAELSLLGPDRSDSIQLVIGDGKGTLPSRGVSRVDLAGTWFGVPFEGRIESTGLRRLLSDEVGLPVEAVADWDGIHATARGSIDDLFRFEGLRVDAQLDGAAIDELGRRFGVAWPAAGAYSATASVGWKEDLLSIDGAGVIGPNELEAELALGFEDPLYARGRIRAGVLSLAALGTETSEVGSEELPLPFDVLAKLDAEIELQAEGLREPGLDRAFSGSLQVQEGVLRVDAKLPLTDELLDLGLVVDASGGGEQARLALDATARRIPGADLAAALGRSDLQGEIRDFELALRAKGGTLAQLRRTASGVLAASGGELRLVEADAPPIAVRFGASTARALAGGTVRAELPLVLQGVPLDATLELSSRARKIGFPADLEISLRSDAIEANARGGVTMEPPGLALDFDASASELGGLSAWFGVAAGVKAPVSMRGNVVLEEGEWAFGLKEARVGKTLGSLTITDPDVGVAGFTARLDLDRLDLGELAAVFGSDAVEVLEPGEGVVIDFPVLPGVLDVDATTIELHVDEVIDELDLSDLTISGVLLDGRSLRGRIEGRVDGAWFEGSIDAELAGPEPSFEILAKAGAFDAGSFARSLGVADDLDLVAQGLAVEFSARGTDDERLAETARLRASLDGAVWTIRDPKSDATLVMDLAGRLEVDPGGPLQFRAVGESGGIPLRVWFESGSLLEIVRDAAPVPLDLILDRGHGTLEVVGSATLPVEANDLDAELIWKAESLADWALVPGLVLPALGPFEVRTRVRATDDGYHFGDLQMELGESDLAGELRLRTVGSPLRLDGALVSNQLRLEDLRPSEDAPAPEAESGVPRGRLTPLRDPALFAGIEGQVSLEFEKLTFGGVELGTGRVRGQIGEGRLAIAPIEFTLGGGQVFGAMYWAPNSETTDWEFVLKTPRFDYTPFAQAINPDTEARGEGALDIALHASDPKDRLIGARANGRIGIAAWPKDMAAKPVDLWALNLVVAVLPVMNIVKSNVNCLVGRLEVEAGTARPDPLLIDTTTTRIEATGTIDFDREVLSLRLQPVPKIRQVWSLATPLQIKGGFADFGARVQPQGLVGTAFQFYASPLLAPLTWLFGRTPPSDGSDVCVEPFRASPE